MDDGIVGRYIQLGDLIFQAVPNSFHAGDWEGTREGILMERAVRMSNQEGGI